MIKANVRAAPIANLSDQWERHAGQLIWKEAPRDAFKSVRDCKRWSERHRGKPIDETLGALRVALVENKARRKWQVQVILGARRHALSAHDDQQRAQEDYSLARCLFYPDPAWVEAMGCGCASIPIPRTPKPTAPSASGYVDEPPHKSRDARVRRPRIASG